jgi:hypothetical protein
VQASVLPEELRPVLGLEPDPLVDALLRRYRFMPGGGDKLRPLHGALLPPGLAEGLRGWASHRPAPLDRPLHRW